jgi:CHASE2 domain-containing sensor protein
MADHWTLIAAAICAAIFTRIMAYQREGARYRAFVSFLAYVLAMSTGCFALSVSVAAVTGKPIPATSPFLLAVLAVMLVLVYRAKGNIATIMRMDWTGKWDGHNRRGRDANQ